MQIIQILKDMSANITRDCEDGDLNKDKVLERLIHLCDVLNISPYDYLE